MLKAERQKSRSGPSAGLPWNYRKPRLGSALFPVDADQSAALSQAYKRNSQPIRKADAK
jgi:hypothetical protein